MEGEPLNQRVVNFIGELERRGLVDIHFRTCYTLKENGEQHFFENLLQTFTNDIGSSIGKVIFLLSQTVLDFDELFESSIKLKGMTGCFGAVLVSKASQNLGEASLKRQKDGCVRALNEIRIQYDSLRTQLEILLQMEREINRGTAPAFR